MYRKDKSRYLNAGNFARILDMSIPLVLKKRLAQLRTLVDYHQKRYHEDDAPEISDETYDSLVKELSLLEIKTSSTRGKVAEKIGGSVSEAFAKVKHIVPQWSFDNVFSAEELVDWEGKLLRQLEQVDLKKTRVSYVAEHKIDGLKLVLTYKEGLLVRAVTRGDGVTGEDVTHTAKTIKDIPLKLLYPVDLICVGEVWLAKKEFERINKERAVAGEALFANPRNAAAGSLRQLDPEIARRRHLSMFCYDIDMFTAGRAKLVPPATQYEELALLAQLGLPTNSYPKKCSTLKKVITFYNQWKDKHHELPYGVDGVVVKVDNIEIQKSVGYTTKAPRFGIAFKFPAEQTTTVVENIGLQVGRTGVVTPVAHLRPVLIAGSTVARATLHNEDQIKRLDVRIGDTVILQKAGDVIPEIVSVLLPLRPPKTKPYKFPSVVPGCGGDGSIERIPGGSAYRCVVLESDYLRRRKLYYFVSKHAFNIDGVGPKIIDALLNAEIITHHFDLFTCTKEDFLSLEGFKEKAADNAVDAIDKARTQTLAILLTALSIEQVGEETARLLADQFGSLEKIRSANVDDLAVIHGVGAIVAQSMVDWFTNPANQRDLDELLKYVTIIETTAKKRNSRLTGKTIVLTGTLENLSRDEAKDLIRLAGGKVSSSVSAKTDFVVVGKDAGSKSDDAVRLGVKTLSETEFRQLLA